MPGRRPVAMRLRPSPHVRIGGRKWAVLLPFSIPRGSFAGVVPWQGLFAALGLVSWACACQAMPGRRSVAMWLRSSPHVRICGRKWPGVLPFAIPRGSFAGVLPRRKLFAAHWLSLLVCACSARFHLQLCPLGLPLSLFVAPSKMLGDIDDSRWPTGVTVVLVFARLPSCFVPWWHWRK